MTSELMKLAGYGSGRLIIRDVTDETYPHATGGMNFSWCRANFYGIDDGLQLLLKHETAIIDRGGFWKILPSDDADYGQDESKFHRINVRVIGRIDEDRIVRIAVGGDDFYADPQVVINAPDHGEPFAPFTFRRVSNDELLDPIKRL